MEMARKCGVEEVDEQIPAELQKLLDIKASVKAVEGFVETELYSHFDASLEGCEEGCHCLLHCVNGSCGTESLGAIVEEEPGNESDTNDEDAEGWRR